MELPGEGEFNEGFRFALFQKAALGHRSGKSSRADRVVLLDPQDNPGPLGIKDPEQYGLADPSHPRQALDLFHLVIADGHGRTGENRPGKLLRDIPRPLDRDIGPDLLQGALGRLTIGGGEGIEDNQQGDAYG